VSDLVEEAEDGQDRQVTEVPKPIDAALDLLLYVPVGLAITAAEELPKLAAKGRDRVHSQMTMARVVGQFAFAQGRKQLEHRLSARTHDRLSAGTHDRLSARTHDRRSAQNWGGQAETPARPPVEPEPEITYEDMVGVNGQTATPERTITSDAVGANPPRPSPRSAELAIPGYDSLSASQVVQRLAGLSPEELAAVGAYEQAHRARRTILNRVSQLQGR
jgi:hypothetical protein